MDPFLDRKSGEGSNINFDLSPLIKNFSFYDFISQVNSKSNEDYSAFGVITDKQYIVGYNAGFGNGTHRASYIRTMKDLKGGGSVNNSFDALMLEMECSARYLRMRVLYDKVREDENGKSIYDGGLIFMLPNFLTYRSFEVFKKFYNDYNDDIKNAIKKSNGSFKIIVNDNFTSDRLVYEDLDGVYKFLEKRVGKGFPSDYDYFDEKIIGTPIEEYIR